MHTRLLYLLVGIQVILTPAWSSQAPPKFLGFELGEERRYVLGPAEELFAGEQAMWSIQLREVLADPVDGIFELAYQWQLPSANADLPIGTVVRVDSSGEMRVNAHGFPLEVRFETFRHFAGLGDEIYTIRYRFEDGTFVKHVTKDGDSVEHEVQVRADRDVDLDVPRGLYAFVPDGLDCERTSGLDSSQIATVDRQLPSAGSASSPSTPPTTEPGFARAAPCSEGMFFNPGLLSFVLPTLWEQETGEYDFVVLTPAGPFGMPGIAYGGGTAGVGVRSNRRPFDSMEASRASTNSDSENLRYVDRVQVQVGRRTQDAWRFEGLDVADALYVDDDGVVLRLDLSTRRLSGPGAAVGGDPSSFDVRGLYVRLLYPSEY